MADESIECSPIQAGITTTSTADIANNPSSHNYLAKKKGQYYQQHTFHFLWDAEEHAYYIDTTNDNPNRIKQSIKSGFKLSADNPADFFLKPSYDKTKLYLTTKKEKATAPEVIKNAFYKRLSTYYETLKKRGKIEKIEDLPTIDTIFQPLTTEQKEVLQAKFTDGKLQDNIRKHHYTANRKPRYTQYELRFFWDKEKQIYYTNTPGKKAVNAKRGLVSALKLSADSSDFSLAPSPDMNRLYLTSQKGKQADSETLKQAYYRRLSNYYETLKNQRKVEANFELPAIDIIFQHLTAEPKEAMQIEIIPASPNRKKRKRSDKSLNAEEKADLEISVLSPPAHPSFFSHPYSTTTTGNLPDSETEEEDEDAIALVLIKKVKYAETKDEAPAAELNSLQFKQFT